MVKLPLLYDLVIGSFTDVDVLVYAVALRSCNLIGPAYNMAGPVKLQSAVNPFIACSSLIDEVIVKLDGYDSVSVTIQNSGYYIIWYTLENDRGSAGSTGGWIWTTLPYIADGKIYGTFDMYKDLGFKYRSSNMETYIHLIILYVWVPANTITGFSGYVYGYGNRRIRIFGKPQS